MKKLYLSFGSLTLDNLPVGAFRRRQLPVSEAKALILQAKRDGLLQGVCDEDLFSPGMESKANDHEELRQVLCDAHNIQLSMEDFTLPGSGFETVFPLNLVEVTGEHNLMIVTFSYTFRESGPDERFDINAMFQADPHSIEFDLLESWPPSQANKTDSEWEDPAEALTRLLESEGGPEQLAEEARELVKERMAKRKG